ncbi:MAG: YfhO family protein [Anaerolineae bacterium]|nr:YfhO family protein [Anaerolineae bacterium]
MIRSQPRLPARATGPAVIAVAVLTALWALFFWRLLTPASGDHALFAQGDFPVHFYAFSSYQSDRLWDGEVPLWNSYNYGGEPFAANPQFAAWYPPRWIALLLTGPDGWRIESHQMEVAAHYWLASVTMYLLLRALVRRPAPALLGSLIWTYGGFLTGYPMLQPSIAEGLAWLPLALLGAHLSLTAPRWRVRGILLSGGALALTFLAGHPQTTTYTVYLVLAYLAFTGWRLGLRPQSVLWRGALLGLVSAGLAAVQLLPAYELMQRSYRAENFHYFDKAVGFAFTELIQVIWPRLFDANWWPLYPGVLALLLVILAMLRPQRATVFWLGVIAVGLWLTVGGASVVYDVFYALAPGWNIFRQQERAAALVALAVAVVAAYELDQLLDPDRAAFRADLRRLNWLARGHLAVAAVAFLAVAFVTLLRDDDLRAVTPNALGFVLGISLLVNAWLAWWARSHAMQRRALAALGLGAILVLDLFSLGVHSPNFVEDRAENRVAEPDNLDLLQREVEDIAWHVDGAAGIQSRGMYWRIPDIYGAVPFQLGALEELRHIRVDRRWEVFAVRYATMIADVPDNVPVQIIGEGVNYDGEDYTLYELEDPRPFAHLVYQARVSDDGRDGAREIMLEPWIDLREIGVVSEPLPFELPGERPPDAEVRAFRMDMPEYLEMEVTTSAPALLTLALANYPGWHAEIDGEPAEIVETYAGLIGVPVPAGAAQKVTLRFLPGSLVAGGVLSAATLAGLVVYLLAAALRNRQRARSGAEPSRS